MWHNPVSILTTFLLFAIFSSPSVYAKKIYKWTDNEGNIHYSDRPHETNQSEKVKIAPGPNQQQKEEAIQREQQLKSTADSLEQDNQQRDQKRAEEQKKREAELAKQKARQPEEPQGQNTDNYAYPRYPIRPRPPVHPRPPVAVPLPSGANPGRAR